MAEKTTTKASKKLIGDSHLSGGEVYPPMSEEPNFPADVSAPALDHTESTKRLQDPNKTTKQSPEDSYGPRE